MTRTFYEVLDVSEDASTEEITDAFREKVRQYHPDRSDRPDATERMQRINRAREVLTDAGERRRYDRMGHRAYVDAATGGSPDRSTKGDPGSGANPGEASSNASRSGRSRDGRRGSGRAGERRSTAGGSATGGNDSGQAGGGGTRSRRAWDPWAGRDPFDGDDSFGGDPFDGDPFDRAGGEWAPNWGDHVDAGSDGTATGANATGAGTWAENAWDAARGRDPSGSWRASTAQDFEWSDEEEVRDRTENGSVLSDLVDWTPVATLRSPLFLAWASRAGLATVLATVVLGAFALGIGPVAPTAGLTVVLGAVVLAFLAVEVALDRVDALDPESFGSRGVDDGTLGRIVAANLAGVGLLSVAGLRGADLFGLTYAVPAAVDGVVLFGVVGPTIGLAVGTFLSSFLLATLGYPFGDLFDEMIALGMTTGFLVGYAATVVVFFTRFGGGLPSVRTPNPTAPGVAYPWVPAIELGPLYVGGVLNFLVSLVVVGTLLVSAYWLVRDFLGLPWADRYARGRAVHPSTWDLALALPVAAVTWTVVTGVERFAPELPGGLTDLAGTRIPLPLSLAFVVPGSASADLFVFALLAAPTLLAGGYALRRRGWHRTGSRASADARTDR